MIVQNRSNLSLPPESSYSVFSIMRHLKDYGFRNWAGNVKAVIPHYFEPETEGGIIEIIQEHDRVRVAGAAHSWNDICVSGEALINLDRYSEIIGIDKGNRSVTVQAGIRLSKLNRMLDREGLALSNLGSIDTQSLAGAIATATHGTGREHRILGSQVEGFTLISAGGEQLQISREGDKDLYEAAMVNLGCLGVVSEMTLNVEDSFNLHDITETIPFDAAVAGLARLLDENDHLKFWWLPRAEDLIVYKYNRTDEPRNDWKVRQIWKERLSSVLFYRSLVAIAKRIPSAADSFNRLLTRNYRRPLDRVEKSYVVFNVPEPPKHRETEWAFDLGRAEEILSAYKKHLNDSGFKHNFIQEIRFTKADRFWLSPSYGRDSLWIGFYNYDHEGWEELLPFHEEFARRYDGRPHWGKEFTCDAGYLKKAYPRFEDFEELRSKLDPGRKFSNAFTDRLFKG